MDSLYHVGMTFHGSRYSGRCCVLISVWNLYSSGFHGLVYEWILCFN